MKRDRKLIVLVLMLGALCLPALRARAAVEDYVPDDALAVLKVKDLAAHYEEFVNSPLGARLADPEFVPQLAEGLEEARKGLEEFEAENEVDVKGVLADILGHECALVVFPDETGVLVVEAQSKGDLRDAVDEFLRVERLTDSLRDTETTRYKGRQIQAGKMKDGDTRYHAISGRMLAVSEDRSAVERVLDTAAGARQPIGDSEDYRDAMALAESDALAVGYVSGAALEAVAERMRKQSEEHGNPIGRLIQVRLAEGLPMTRFLALRVLHGDDLTVRLTAVYEGGRLPEALEAVLPRPGARLEALDLVPSDAAVAVARGLDPSGAWNRMMEMLEEAAPRRARRAEQAMNALVVMVGGVYSREALLDQFKGQKALMVLPAGAPDALPAAALAVGLRETEHIPAALESAVGSLVTFARAGGGHKVALQQSEHEGVRLTTVRVDEPEVWSKLSPTFGVVENTLIVTTSLDAARRIIDTARSGSPVRPLRTHGTPFSMARANARTLAEMLDRHHDFLVRHAVKERGESEAEARRNLAALRKLLSLLDTVEYVGAFGDGRTEHHLHLDLAHDAR